jgi:hypothetical protein
VAGHVVAVEIANVVLRLLIVTAMGALVGILFGYGLASATGHEFGLITWMIDWDTGRPIEAISWAAIGAASAALLNYVFSRDTGSIHR